MHKPKKILDTTTINREYNLARKRLFASCDRCKWHRSENIKSWARNAHKNHRSWKWLYKKRRQFNILSKNFYVPNKDLDFQKQEDIKYCEHFFYNEKIQVFKLKYFYKEIIEQRERFLKFIKDNNVFIT
jgi:hypothetical protein